jgi:hypothetical protein
MTERDKKLIENSKAFSREAQAAAVSIFLVCALILATGVLFNPIESQLQQNAWWLLVVVTVFGVVWSGKNLMMRNWIGRTAVFGFAIDGSCSLVKIVGRKGFAPQRDSDFLSLRYIVNAPLGGIGQRPYVTIYSRDHDERWREVSFIKCLGFEAVGTQLPTIFYYTYVLWFLRGFDKVAVPIAEVPHFLDLLRKYPQESADFCGLLREFDQQKAKLRELCPRLANVSADLAEAKSLIFDTAADLATKSRLGNSQDAAAIRRSPSFYSG